MSSSHLFIEHTK